MKELKKLFLLIPKVVLLFVFGGLMYMGVEILFRGYTHFSMFFVGGLCFVLVGGINEKLPWNMAFVSQMMIASLLVTAVEFAAGVILNLVLGLGVWDYSTLPYNLLGQISLIFSVGWFFLSAIGILLDDWLRYLIYGEERPHYKIF